MPSSHFTLIPEQDKINFCKLIMELAARYGTNAFTKEAAFKVWMTLGGMRVEKRTKSGEIKTDRKNLDLEAVAKYWSILAEGQYIKFYQTRMRDKLHPNLPLDGLKYYVLNPLRVTECQSTKWYQAKSRKIKFQVTESSLTERRCKLLNQLFAQFGATTPFTYEMVTQIPKFYRNVASGKITFEDGRPISEESKIYYRVAANKMEENREGMLDVWNSLIRNNFIIPYKVKGKDGIIKVRQGAYRVNINYAKRCLQA
jgi:hypothetical protein